MLLGYWDHGISSGYFRHGRGGTLSASPGSGQGIDTSRPVCDRVMKAVRLSGPPKHRLVGIRSSRVTTPSIWPEGETVVTSPETSVATQMLPAAVTARLSRRR